MPICLTLFWLLVPDVELEDVCAFAIVADIDNESRLSPITENKKHRQGIIIIVAFIQWSFQSRNER